MARRLLQNPTSHSSTPAFQQSQIWAWVGPPKRRGILTDDHVFLLNSFRVKTSQFLAKKDNYHRSKKVRYKVDNNLKFLPSDFFPVSDDFSRDLDPRHGLTSDQFRAANAPPPSCFHRIKSSANKTIHRIS